MRTATVPLLLSALLIAGLARADILVMRGPEGQLFLTNRGERSGYTVISRYREFRGSSGMGLHSLTFGDSSRYDDTVREVATGLKVDPALIKAVIRAESAFDPRATSIKGAMGLMQLMPDTARMHGVRNAYDPVENIHGGVRHLRYLLNRYAGDVDLVLAAYNAGTRPVDDVRGIPDYPETREYVRWVKILHDHYRTAFAKAAPQPETPSEALARLDLLHHEPEEVYGRTIVLRGGGREPLMTIADEPKPLFTPAPPSPGEILPAL